MIRDNKRWKGVSVVLACAMLPVTAVAQEDTGRLTNVGPYVGGGIGYNQPGDMDLDFRGSSTDPTQPTIPQEFEATPHFGRAAINKYEGNFFVDAVVGYKFQNGFRTEFNLGYRQNDTDGITVFGDPNRQSTSGGVGQSDVNAEPGASMSMPSDATNVKITATSGMFNLWYDLFPNSRFHPYLGGGVGFVRTKLNRQPSNRLTQGEAGPQTTEDETPGTPVCGQQQCEGPRKADDAAFAWQAGAGLRYDWSDSITVGLDYRYLKGGTAEYFPYREQQETHLDGEYDTQSLMLSLNYFFFLPEPPPPPPPPEPLAVVEPPPVCSDGKDNDGDGLIDFPSDRGCTSADDGDETDPAVCSDGLDNDGDGLIDFPDDKGCESADDQDEEDPCKKPVPGERISLKGCGTGDIIVLRGVNFEFDRSRLTADAESILNNVAEELNAYPDITVELSGHTDARGSDKYNQRLSDRRAASVKKYLQQNGVSADRMTTIGFGESRPVAGNETDEGRQRNRRTELKVTSGVAGTGTEVRTQAADPSFGDQSSGDPETDAYLQEAESAPAADEAEAADEFGL